MNPLIGDVSERLSSSRQPGRLPAADRLLRGEQDLRGSSELPQKIYQNGQSQLIKNEILTVGVGHFT